MSDIVEQSAETFSINGVEYKADAFEQEKQKLLEKKIVLVEISKNTFKTRLYD